MENTNEHKFLPEEPCTEKPDAEGIKAEKSAAEDLSAEKVASFGYEEMGNENDMVQSEPIRQPVTQSHVVKEKLVTIDTPIQTQSTLYITGKYKGLPANILANKKAYSGLMTERQMIHLTPEQKAQAKIQFATCNKESDYSSLFRTGADIILEMDADMYERIKKRAIREQVSVATIINRYLEIAGA